MQSVAAQRHRINRVVNFAMPRIGDALSLDTLADVACLSKFHFTRVFQAHLAQTPFAFLSRIRVERAAQALIHRPEKSITDISMECGFSCSQTFSRAFRTRFQMTPKAFRAGQRWHRDVLPGTAVPDQIRDLDAALERAEIVDPGMVRIESRPSYRVAYIRHRGPYFYKDGELMGARDKLVAWAQSKGLWHEKADLIGLCPDNPRITPGDKCIYDVCLPVAADVREDDIVSIQTIPEGTYAVMKMSGSAVTVYSAWEWMAHQWLPTTGAKYDLLSPYEYYPTIDGVPGSPDQGVEICMRLQER